MRSKQMLMGAAVIGCLAATMTSGAYAQEANTIGQFNARTGQQPSSNVRPMRQGQDGNMNATLNARATSNGTSANGQLERHGFTNKSRMNGPTREGRGLVEERAMRGERGAHMSVSEERYGRGWRGERRLYARAEGGYDRGHLAYRERAVGVGAGVAAADYGYRARRLYAYAPTYDVGYTPGPYYSYAPSYDVAVTTGPYYTPGWNVAYAGPYYDYAPGVSFGIGIGPVGIGFGPAWGW
jgi:hypothetical protein